MADYGRYGDAGYAHRGRDRDLGERMRGRDRNGGDRFGRDDFRDEEYGPSRSSMFSGRTGDPDLYREEGRGMFGGRSRSTADRSHRSGGRGREYGREYGYDDHHEGLPIDETGRLIASNKVEGTSVYGRRGERLGSIYNFMVDKRSGQVEYAVMAYGGFLGLGQRYYPLPWRMLSYDTREGGYHIDMTDRDLERAPSFTRDDEPRFSHDYGRRVHDYYGLEY